MGSEIVCEIIFWSMNHDIVGVIPEEYVDGYVIFMGCRFITDKRALIPRLETEELVKYCLWLLREKPSIQTVVDIGTGTGIIPITIAEKIPWPMQIFACDMSQEALSLAQENAHQVQSEKIQFLQWDLLKPIIAHFWHSVPDEILITANLPYLRTCDIHEWLFPEPTMALDGGKNSWFELYERFFDQLFSWKMRPRVCHVVIEFWLWQRDISETFLMWRDCSYYFFSDLRGIERFCHVCLSE